MVDCTPAAAKELVGSGSSKSLGVLLGEARQRIRIYAQIRQKQPSSEVGFFGMGRSELFQWQVR